jgi:hypothetical protein
MVLSLVNMTGTTCVPIANEQRLDKTTVADHSLRQPIFHEQIPKATSRLQSHIQPCEAVETLIGTASTEKKGSKSKEGLVRLGMHRGIDSEYRTCNARLRDCFDAPNLGRAQLSRQATIHTTTHDEASSWIVHFLLRRNQTPRESRLPF